MNFVSRESLSMFPETKSRETLIFVENKIPCSPRVQSLSDLLYSKTKKQILKNALRFQRQDQATCNSGQHFACNSELFPV